MRLPFGMSNFTIFWERFAYEAGTSGFEGIRRKYGRKDL